MNNVVLLPKSGANSIDNLEQLKKHYQNIMPFLQVSWSDSIWDVSGHVKDSARKAKTNKCLYFTQDNGLNNKVKQSRNDMLPFHSQTLSDIAKCHICAKQISQIKSVGSLQIKINTYRFLDNELQKVGLEASNLTNRLFTEALQKAISKLALSTAYRMGVQLNEISKFIDKHQLANVKIKFKSPLKRSENHTASDTKIDLDSIAERSSKLPTHSLLIAIAKLTNMGLTGKDRLYHAITEILFASGLRFDEVISLSADCLYEKEIEEINQLTGDLETFTVWELKYFSKKAECEFSKTIAESMVSIIKPAIDFVVEYNKDVRETISCLEKKQSYQFFPSLEGKCFVSAKDTHIHIASNRQNAAARLKRLGVTLYKEKKSDRLFFYAEELEDTTSNLASSDIKKLWNELKNKTTATKLSEMLFVTQHQREHELKTDNPWDFRLVNHTQYSDFMTGRITHKKGKEHLSCNVLSIFERKNMLLDGKQFAVTSHQFRHFLNTICQLSDSISEIEIARYFGRNFRGDNQAYDHSNKAKIVMDNAQEILAANSITEDQAVEAMVNFTLVDSEEALETIQDLSTTLITAIGLCKHDFADSPCGKHYACLRGCSNYKRTKGNQIEINEIQKIKAQEEKHLIDAKLAVDKEFWGANNWLLSHQALLDGCNLALDIESNDEIPVGQIVSIFPDGTDSCLAIEDINESKGLLV